MATIGPATRVPLWYHLSLRGDGKEWARYCCSLSPYMLILTSVCRSPARPICALTIGAWTSNIYPLGSISNAPFHRSRSPFEICRCGLVQQWRGPNYSRRSFYLHRILLPDLNPPPWCSPPLTVYHPWVLYWFFHPLLCAGSLACAISIRAMCRYWSWPSLEIISGCSSRACCVCRCGDNDGGQCWQWRCSLTHLCSCRGQDEGLCAAPKIIDIRTPSQK